MAYDVRILQSIINAAPPYPQTYSGRGIVISGGGKFLPSAYVAVRSLRDAGCALPIQLWHLGPSELPRPFLPLFSALDVQLVDALEIQKIHPMKNLGGWQSKPFSIVHCPFKEVFSFDADNVALLNPEFLFELPQYKTAGSIFWPDFAFTGDAPWRIKQDAWSLLGLPPKEGSEIESGQLLIDKEKCWQALQVAFHMNDNSDFYYTNCTYGDKDTYTLAWALCNKEAYVIPHRPKLFDDMVRMQYSPDRRPLFQHSRKWILPSAANPHMESYQLEEKCLSWLREFEGELKNIFQA